MFYLIRINRRDKPHSRTGNDNAAKNNSCPGNERANFNYRKKPGEEKCTWHHQGGKGYEVSAVPEPHGPEAEIKGTKWPFQSSFPPLPHHRQTGLKCAGLGKPEGLPGS